MNLDEEGIMSNDNDMKIEFDEVTQFFYIIWQPIVVGAGNTHSEAMEDLREAAHFGVDSIINLKLNECNRMGLI